jgi:hypothetical protein
MDGQESLLQQLKLADCMCSLMALLGMLAALVEQEFLFEKTDTKARYE